MKVDAVSLHRVFYGNPGTGKTRVARLYAQMLSEFGFLSEGGIVETKPSQFLGRLVL